MVDKGYRAVIADDEPLLRHHLNKLLADAWPELEIVGLAKNGQEALELIEQKTRVENNKSPHDEGSVTFFREG